MIKSVELANFLSHPDTKLEFDNGVTVFVGENGAGKSSIIDAITFALFGQHTRKSNRGLIKRGSNQGFVKAEFTVNGKDYQVERKIDSKGGLSAQFSELVDGKTNQLAAGERKQFGESMTKEVEKRIGLDFEKLKIASIVQQGELNSIIKAKPKEFKELLNAVIGIDKLDASSDAIKQVLKSFREEIQEEFGYDDTHIEILKKELEMDNTELKDSQPLKSELDTKRKKTETELYQIKSALDAESPKLDKIKNLDARKDELRSYAREAIQKIKRDITEKERKLRDCEGCFELVGERKNLETKLEMAESSIEDAQNKVQELSNKKASLQEKLELAKKLQLKDNKCPVCDSKVSKLNPLFQENHLKEELESLRQGIESTNEEKQRYQTKRQEFSSNLQRAKDAEATLRAHGISSKSQLESIRTEVKQQRNNIQNVPLTITSGNLVAAATIDSHAKMLFETISQLEDETKDFDETKFLNLKNKLDEKQSELSFLDQKLGEINGKISSLKEKITKIESTLKELHQVKDYVDEIDVIRENIFNRDGAVATSLRSWALNTISSKASEYLALLNTKIQRIHLSEKKRNINITCHSKREILDLESLSGGEQVSIALSLRLGLASLLGASNLNLMILDEPTTHLDAERRKALVSVLSQLSDVANSGMPMQFVIITHDSEIFEDSTVEQVYKFESTADGSLVTIL